MKQLEFRIDGQDYEKLMEFQKDHQKCLAESPNITGAQYEYSFVPGGFGVFKTVKCICGETIALTGDYDPVLGDGGQKGSAFKVSRRIKCDKTVRLLRHLRMVEKRTGLFFGKSYSWKNLRIYLLGMTAEARVVKGSEEDCAQCDSREFAEIVHDMMSRVQTDIDSGKIKEENAPEEFFRHLWNKVRREYPELAQQFICNQETEPSTRRKEELR